MHLRGLEQTVLNYYCLENDAGLSLLGGAMPKGGDTAGVIKPVISANLLPLSNRD